MTIEDMAEDLNNLRLNFNEIFASKLPKEAGKVAEDNFAANFPAQGFNGGEWEPLKKPEERLILVKTGKGLQDVQNSAQDPIVTDEEVTVPFIVDDDYMNYHNLGNDRLPIRQFSGESEELEDAIVVVIEKNLEVLEK